MSKRFERQTKVEARAEQRLSLLPRSSFFLPPRLLHSPIHAHEHTEIERGPRRLRHATASSIKQGARERSRQTQYRREGESRRTTTNVSLSPSPAYEPPLTSTLSSSPCSLFLPSFLPVAGDQSQHSAFSGRREMARISFFASAISSVDDEAG